MELIKAINGILAKDLDKECLKNIWCLVQWTNRFEMLVSGINDAAVSGQKDEMGRAVGPQARTERKNAKMEIARELVSDYWGRNPLQRGKLDPTVRGIIVEFNTRVRDLGLKPIE